MLAHANRFFAALAAAQHRTPWRFLIVAAIVAAVSMPWVLRLRLNSDFQAMLPESSRSVRDLDEIRARFGGTSTLTLAIQDTRTEGADVPALRDFTRALAAELEGLDGLEVVHVDWNVRDFYEFVRTHQHLYADLSDLTEIRDALEARLAWERERNSPFYLGLDDEGEAPPDPEAVLARIREDADRAEREMDRFPEGFYQHPDLPLIFVFLRTSIRGGEEAATQRLIAAVEDAAARTLAARGMTAPTATRAAGSDVGLVAGELRIDYGGDLMDVLEETEALKEAVALSTLITLVLLLVSIFAFYLRWRALPLLLLTLVAPCLFAFGVTQPIVESLNTSSAFLASIVIGNGVNSSIMWLGRYFEERRKGIDVQVALREAHLGTWQGTLAAAFAAALAYGSLAVTDYRGFRDFGLIGLVGMLSCWIAAYTVLPALTVAFDRVRPMAFTGPERKGIYGVVFARLSLASPQRLLVLSGLVTLVTAGATVWAAQSDPLEYDFRNLQAERSPESRVAWVNARLGDWADETLSGSAVAILAPTNEDVPHIVAELTAYREEHPEAIGAVRTIDDMLPQDQAAKIPILADLRRLMLEARPYLSEDRRSEIDEHLPPEAVTPVGLDDLPESVARSFTERDGSRGRLVFIEHADGRSTWDGRYQIEWARGARSAHAIDGSEPAVAGTAVVFADLISSIFSEAPLAMAVSFLTTVVLVLFSFRRMRERLFAMVAMLVGVLWMTGALALLQVKLNFLNMMAFPITFGIGLEYAVNFVKRYQEEREKRTVTEAVRAALEGAGGAVILCSLTTLIGYISLYTSSNQALNSFGLAMSLGEITCLLSSVLALPALLVFVDGRSERPKTVSNPPAAE